MPTPSFKNLSPRYKSLTSPVVWAPLTIVALLSVFVWEFTRNPDWFNREEPATELDNASNLTAEEKARLSEIDTLEVLIEQSRAAEGNPLATGLLDSDPSEVEIDLEAGQEDALTTNSRQLSGRANPFEDYEAEYAFPGSGSATLTPGGTPSAPSSSGGSGSTSAGANGGSFRGGSTTRTAPVTNSALSDALDRQQAAAEGADSTDRQSAGTRTLRPSQSPAIDSGSSGLSTPNSAGSSTPFGSSGSQGGATALPNTAPITVPFNRTDASMSPPVGTTGYRPPATSTLPVFNTAPAQPTPNPFPVPQTNLGQSSNGSSAAPSSNTNQSGTLYTAPTSVQPEQNRR